MPYIIRDSKYGLQLYKNVIKFIERPSTVPWHKKLLLQPGPCLVKEDHPLDKHYLTDTI